MHRYGRCERHPGAPWTPGCPTAGPARSVCVRERECVSMYVDYDMGIYTCKIASSSRRPPRWGCCASSSRRHTVEILTCALQHSVTVNTVTAKTPQYFPTLSPSNHTHTHTHASARSTHTHIRLGSVVPQSRPHSRTHTHPHSRKKKRACTHAHALAQENAHCPGARHI